MKNIHTRIMDCPAGDLIEPTQVVGSALLHNVGLKISLGDIEKSSAHPKLWRTSHVGMKCLTVCNVFECLNK